MDFSGRLLDQDQVGKKILKNTSQRYHTLNLNPVLENCSLNDVVLVVEIREGSEVLNRDLVYLVKEGDLNLPQVNIKQRILQDPKALRIEISANKLVKDLYLYYDQLDGYFTDNFFTLIPGERKVIEFIPYSNITRLPKIPKLIHFKGVLD